MNPGHIQVERRGPAAVAWLKGSKHRFYEDRYRILNRNAPLVQQRQRGEVFAVFDGISSEEGGMRAAQEMCDRLSSFFREPDRYPASAESLQGILLEGNNAIYGWGKENAGPYHVTGGCAGTVVWIHKNWLISYQAGDTVALLLRDGRSEQLTELHEINNALYRFFGLGPELNLDISRWELQETDRILLLTDGVTKVINPRKAGDFINTSLEELDDLDKAVRGLAEQARGLGSTDDITVLLIEVEEFWYPGKE